MPHRRVTWACLHLVLAGHLLQRCCGYHSHHHIYEDGEAEDSCAGSDFQPGYWVQPSARGTELLGTRHAQRAIWEHQHPASCAGKRFLVWQPCANGIGSTWHIMGQALAHALTMDRIFLVAGDTENSYYDPEWCGPDAHFHDCYFEATSSCTLEGALGGTLHNVSALLEVKKPELDDPALPVVRIECTAHDYHQPAAAFVSTLESSVIPGAAYTYWWRAQSVAYLFR